MRPENDSIALNFFPLVEQRLRFQIFRQAIDQSEGDEFRDDVGVSCYRLPDNGQGRSGDDYREFWVSFQGREGFSTFECRADTNTSLTKRLLFALLCERSSEALLPDDFRVSTGFERKVHYRLASFPEGDQCVWLSPYYLASERLFGFLADFHFCRAPSVPFDRRVQQLSLSLDGNFRENSGSYSDRHRQLKLFLNRYQKKLFPLSCTGAAMVTPPPDISPRLKHLPRAHLSAKTYVFAKDRQGGSQFQGVKSHGPLTPAPEGRVLCFIYRPADRPLSHDLYRALRGDAFPTFPGMEGMFKFPLGSEHVTGLPVDSFDPEALQAALNGLKEIRVKQYVVPVVLVPWRRVDGPNASVGYYRAKHVFLRNGLPSQFVSVPLLQDKQSFKWSVSNIALGIFSKLGGQPWKVQPRNDHCLIIGIGKSHKFDETGKVTRYFAYSVLSDSSGLYEDLCPLSQSSDEGKYLANLTKTLVELLDTRAKQYEKFTIHTTFALRRAELEAVKSALSAFAEHEPGKGRLVALKFNDNSDLFGYAEANNSLVPYESSYVRLSATEFLVWFEGLQYHNPNLRKRIARPVHTQFIFPTDEPLPGATMRDHLQDALNLSGANWRGFNAKTLPVSVYYAQLLSRYFGEFDRLGLDLPRLEHMTPWFL